MWSHVYTCTCTCMSLGDRKKKCCIDTRPLFIYLPCNKEKTCCIWYMTHCLFISHVVARKCRIWYRNYCLFISQRKCFAHLTIRLPRDREYTNVLHLIQNSLFIHLPCDSVKMCCISYMTIVYPNDKEKMCCIDIIVYSSRLSASPSTYTLHIGSPRWFNRGKLTIQNCLRHILLQIQWLKWVWTC